MRNILLIIFFVCFGFILSAQDSDSTTLSFARLDGTLHIPMHSKVMIDGRQASKMPDESYFSISTSKGFHKIAISKKNFIERDFQKNSYFFIILFKKDYPIRKYMLIEVTEEYFQSLPLEKYWNLAGPKELKWH
jgi:hypothetical protein